jgi:prophage regulatory protein
MATTRLLNVNEAAEKLGCSRSSWWRGVKAGRFPQPIRIAGMTRWREDEIDKDVIGRATAERDGKAA